MAWDCKDNPFFRPDKIFRIFLYKNTLFPSSSEPHQVTRATLNTKSVDHLQQISYKEHLLQPLRKITVSLKGLMPASVHPAPEQGLEPRTP